MTFTIRRTPYMRQQRSHRLHPASASGSLRLVQRLHALLASAAGRAVSEAAARLAWGAHTVRDYRHQCRGQGVASVGDKRPPGRPSQWTKTPRQALAPLLKAGPHTSGSPSGGWNTPRIQDLMDRRFGVEYPPHSMGTVRHTLGFAYQTARWVSEHPRETKRLAWRHTRWPRMVRQAPQRKALRRLGDEARGAQEA